MSFCVWRVQIILSPEELWDRQWLTRYYYLVVSLWEWKASPVLALLVFVSHRKQNCSVVIIALPQPSVLLSLQTDGTVMLTWRLLTLRVAQRERVVLIEKACIGIMQSVGRANLNLCWSVWQHSFFILAVIVKNLKHNLNGVFHDLCLDQAIIVSRERSTLFCSLGWKSDKKSWTSSRPLPVELILSSNLPLQCWPLAYIL